MFYQRRYYVVFYLLIVRGGISFIDAVEVGFTYLQWVLIQFARDIVDNGFNPDRVKNNARLLTRESLMGLLEEMY